MRKLIKPTSLHGVQFEGIAMTIFNTSDSVFVLVTRNNVRCNTNRMNAEVRSLSISWNGPTFKTTLGQLFLNRELQRPLPHNFKCLLILLE